MHIIQIMATPSDHGSTESFGPDWLTGDLGKYPVDKGEKMPTSVDSGIYQQSDQLKPMLLDIAKHGLDYTYRKYKGHPLPIKNAKTSKKKHVIVVGAGLAGLSAAYELTKAGHEVDILEMQNRVGGRVKTLREKDGFSKHLYIEGG